MNDTAAIQDVAALQFLPAWDSHDENLTLKRTAVVRLLEQLAILEVRIESSWDQHLLVRRGDLHFLVRNCLLLDVETYYTVAADLLKIVARMFPDAVGRRQFEREPAYRRIMALRNHFIRHAYDKADGDPHNGFACGSDSGLRLKGGSPLQQAKAVEDRMEDAGHIANFYALHGLLDRYRLQWPALAEEARQALRMRWTEDSSQGSGDRRTRDIARGVALRRYLTQGEVMSLLTNFFGSPQESDGVGN